MEIKLTPRHDRILVRPDQEEEKSAGGIMLAPSSSKEKPQRGTVLSVGSGKIEDGKVIPVELSKGMKVLFSKFSGTDVKVSGEDLLILRDEDIIAVVE